MGNFATKPYKVSYYSFASATRLFNHVRVRIFQMQIATRINSSKEIATNTQYIGNFRTKAATNPKGIAKTHDPKID